MDSTTLLYIVQDGLVNGSVYALLGIALVLVFTVTRIIWIPQGDLVAFTVLTLTALQQGDFPAIVWLLVGLSVTAGLFDLIRARRKLTARLFGRVAIVDVVLPLALVLVVQVLAPLKLGLFVEVVLTAAILIPLSLVIYRLVFAPLAEASVLVLLIAAFGVHLALIGFGLLFFGPEGVRTESLLDFAVSFGRLLITGQNIAMVITTLLLLVALWLIFDRTLTGKALRASAINRTGARLVGIPMALSGMFAIGIAALIGVVSGVLIGPVTTVYFDTGLMIGLKGFIASIVGAMISYPVTVGAALVVGLTEAFASFGLSAYKEAIVFSLLIPVLLWRSLSSVTVEEDEE
ncbi:branched-chain amino acid ABC transporter permease [Pseudorhodoplanes sp.]|uniref:branched-chain amino acid ABC transporter permease n=1 Tax=Pseudorhodoplanes sp. TaxID=1934341 RepID=UPI002C177BBD|nr:branched-chain amino acid ABC transporter permease [Pseudorhodoplanes sp.]HWV55491.1 branched-chain amino acid ABC transporter permease [Pseudorhodoplanes sp.]